MKYGWLEHNSRAAQRKLGGSAGDLVSLKEPSQVNTEIRVCEAENCEINQCVFFYIRSLLSYFAVDEQIYFQLNRDVRSLSGSALYSFCDSCQTCY